MGIFSFLKREKVHSRNSHVVLFDITSGSVGASLVRFDDKVQPEIIEVVRKQFSYKEEEYTKPHLTAMLETLENVATTLHTRTHTAPSAVYCFLSAPWYNGSSTSIKQRADVPFAIEKKTVSKMLSEKIKDFKVHAKHKYFGGDEVSILEKKTIQIKLNGFPVDKVKKGKVKELDVSFYLSASPKNLLSNIESRINQVYHRNVCFASYLFTSYIVSRDIFGEDNDYLLVDISGNMSEVSLVRDDILLETHTFPFGTHTFIKKISKELNTEVEHARSLFSMYKHQVLEEKTQEKVKRAVASVMGQWIKSVRNVLVEISDNNIVPRTVMMASNSDNASLYKHLINDEQLTVLLTTANEFNVIILDIAQLHNFVSMRSEQHDTNLIMETIFIDHIAS